MKRMTSKEIMEGFHSVPVHRTLIFVAIIMAATVLIGVWLLSTAIGKLNQDPRYGISSTGEGVFILDRAFDEVTFCNSDGTTVQCSPSQSISRYSRP